MIIKVFSIILVTIIVFILSSMINDLRPFISAFSEPTVMDPGLKVETVFEGLKFPTSMAFLGMGISWLWKKMKGR